MRNYDNLSEEQKDVLREVGNIGGGNAATALASILTDKIDMSVPNLSIVDINKVSEILGGPENEAVGILVSMTDDVKGMLLFILDKHFTRLLLSALLDKEIDSFESINEMDMSALKEMGNILSGAYVSALCSMTGLNIMLSTPSIAIDMVGAILNYPAAIFGMISDSVLYIEEDFFSSGNSIKSHLLIMPEIDSLNTILKRLGVD